MTDLAVEIANTKLANPTILAAGILGMSGATLSRVASAGAGAVVTKSVGLHPCRGYPNPTVVSVEGGLLNAMGLPNPGIEYFAQEIHEMTAVETPLIVSIYGSTAKEFAWLAQKAQEAGANAIELNLSCPHAKGVGAEIGQDPRIVEEIVAATKRSVEMPVFAKLTPNIASIQSLATAAERGGADAVVAINTVKAMVIDVETATPILANKVGGLSGPAIRPIAVRCVYEIFQAVQIPIIGCGGVESWKDAVEMMQAGATAIQLGTAVATKGLEVFKQVTDGIESFLKRMNLRSVKEIVGLSHRI